MGEWELLRSACIGDSTCRNQEYKYGYRRIGSYSTEFIVFHRETNIVYISVLYDGDASDYIELKGLKPKKSLCDLIGDPRTLEMDRYGTVVPIFAIQNRKDWRGMRTRMEKLERLLGLLESEHENP